MDKVRWGILSTAKIGREKVIPALQGGQFCEVLAIASRNLEQAQAAAALLNIPVAYGSYEELLNDQNIDAVYIPLPNNLHVPWAIKAIQANKHVLCEKPVGLSSTEAKELIDAAGNKPGLKIMEAFMYRFHPQWQHTLKLVQNGTIGELRNIHSLFTYYNADPGNIRNQLDIGGGGLMDIGCYCISLARFLFDKEPARVLGIAEYDPELQTDRLTSGILDFTTGTSLFTCSTQLMSFQRVNISGTKAHIEIEIPFNAPPDKPTRIRLYTQNKIEELSFEPVNQYTLQGDLFSKAILANSPVPIALADALNNMLAIEAIFESAKEQNWKTL